MTYSLHNSAVIINNTACWSLLCCRWMMSIESETLGSATEKQAGRKKWMIWNHRTWLDGRWAEQGPTLKETTKTGSWHRLSEPVGTWAHSGLPLNRYPPHYTNNRRTETFPIPPLLSLADTVHQSSCPLFLTFHWTCFMVRVKWPSKLWGGAGHSGVGRLLWGHGGRLRWNFTWCQQQSRFQLLNTIFACLHSH